MVNVNKKGKTCMNLPKPFTTPCSPGLCPPCATASSRGRWLPGVPLEIPAVWGLWEPPALQFSLAFGSSTDWMNPYAPYSQVDLYLISGVTFPFPTSQRRCRSPRGDHVPFGLGAAGRDPALGLCVVLGAGCPQSLGAGGGKSLLGEGA